MDWNCIKQSAGAQHMAAAIRNTVTRTTTTTATNEEEPLSVNINQNQSQPTVLTKSHKQPLCRGTTAIAKIATVMEPHNQNNDATHSTCGHTLPGPCTLSGGWP